jgi:hypothetical protein
MEGFMEYKKMHLRPYVNLALLWINMAENRNYPITYGMKDEKTKTILTDLIAGGCYVRVYCQFHVSQL